MLRFKNPGAKPEEASAPVPSAKAHEHHPLDEQTGGAFSAPTSGERAARIREWLAGNPPQEQIQAVFKDLSARDKGAAKPLRERLDELRRARGQEAIAAEWAGKAAVLLSAPRLNIADALAWQRDAAKAGAALSKEPLAALKLQLAERVKVIEDLQHRTQVQREAAVLLAHRIEVLGTKSWSDAQTACEALGVDVSRWQTQANALLTDTQWSSVDAKFAPLLDASRTQLLAVWEAFQAALSQARLAAQDVTAALPAVPVWADEIRSMRGVAVEATTKPPKPKVDPEVRAKARQLVQDALTRLEQEVAEGHGKASAGAAAGLRNALKENGKLVDDKLENAAHAALAAAGELEGWQRWRADQLREELLAKAEALVAKPLGGRKQQETLRGLRDQWKQTDQGGVPNHAMWKRFDDACNEAYKVVEAWLEKVKADSEAHKGQRLALIEELKAWGVAHADSTDWKTFNRDLHAFGERWREAGHLSEKAFEQLQPLWKEAIHLAHAPLEAAQKASVERRQAMIAESIALGESPQLRIDAVKALQQRWQAEAQAVPLERKFEQKLWDAFRKPIDEAFNRKTVEREKASSAMSEHDRGVLEAAKALDQANASGDAQRIRAAMAGLDAALRGEPPAARREEAPVAAPAAPVGAQAPVAAADGSAAGDGAVGPALTLPDQPSSAPMEAPVAAPKPAKPVVAVRGDDRPGMKKTEAAVSGRGGKFGERKGAPTGGKFGERRDERGPRPEGRGATGDRFAERHGFEPRRDDRGPRLGDAAFRAQREALERAEFALKKLAAQAHGEVLTHLLTAWEKRAADQLPGQQELGRAVTPAVRGAWVQTLVAAASGDASESLLRLEMAAELPTPAEHLNARRAMQLQLLTRRNDPTPVQTWGQDAAKVMASAYDAGAGRRLQAALKVLLRK